MTLPVELDLGTTERKMTMRPDVNGVVETRPDWGLHLQPVGGLLVDRPSLGYVRLTGEALEIALQMARTGSLEKTARVRAGVKRGAVALLQDELKQALAESPITAAWLDGALGRRIRVSGSSEAYLPLVSSLQLTNACNLSCSFCYASSGKAMPLELTPDQWIQVIEQLSLAGVAAVILTGGEPTIARGFRSILAGASALIDAVDVFTNGLHWPDDLISMVAACGNVRVQVSIDGLAPRHDLIRGRDGAYAESLNTIRRVSAAGLEVLVGMTVTPTNYLDLAEVIRDVDAAGARTFRASRVVAVGRGDGHHFALTDDQVGAVTRQFQEVSGLTIRALAWGRCGDLGEQLAGTGLPVEFLTPGYLSWHIRADGCVTPCQIEDSSIGQILAEPLVAIGAPDRLERVRSVATSCQCIRRLNPEQHVDLPFAAVRRKSLPVARAPHGSGSACARGEVTRGD